MQPQSLEPNVLIAGRYRLERVLGEGGMGTVWEATHTVTRRSVAMKFLKEALLDKPVLRKRFLREAIAASALHHPNVVEVLDVFDLDERVSVLVMELLRGETLGAKLLRDERLSVEETAALLLPVVSAVGMAHSMGIVHRDLKPDNIFLAASGDAVLVKVLDFGIAKLVTEQHLGGHNPSLHTDTGAMLGTPCYMAPEQATGEGELDHRADIWSLGIILYECLSGTRPIEGDNLAQVVTRLIGAGIIPLERLAPELPPELSAAVTQMLVRDPGRRAQDLTEINKILARHTRGSVPAFQAPGSLPRLAVEAPPVQSVPIAVVKASELAKGDTKAATLISAPAASSLTLSPTGPKKSPPQIRFIVLVIAGVGVALIAMKWLIQSQGPALVQTPPTSASAIPARTAPLPTGALSEPAPGRAPMTNPAATVTASQPMYRPAPARSGPKRSTGAGKPEPSVAIPAKPRDEGVLFGGRK